MRFRHYFAESFGLETRMAVTVFALVLAALAVSLVLSRRRRKAGQESSQRAKNTRLELLYLGVVAVVAAFLAVLSVVSNNRETAGPPPAALKVQVTAFQWCWRFHYVGQPVTVTGQCEGKSLPTLVLPAHRAVRLEVTSADVIHGFWLPYLRWKIYAYPGHVNSFTVTLSQDGKWIGRCSELCGLYHYEMDFYLQVVSPARFDQWLHARGGAAAAVSS